jgi:hypothetical protein
VDLKRAAGLAIFAYDSWGYSKPPFGESTPALFTGAWCRSVQITSDL